MWFKKKRIYLDYASMTPIDRRVLEVMNKYSSSYYANPSSFYAEGVRAKNVLDENRKKVADFIHANTNEIVFTSGSTESNNLALIGPVEALHEKGVPYEEMQVIVSVIEHSSIRESANYLSEKGVKVEVLGVDKYGLISLDELKEKLSPKTVIVSVMMVNNEIGTVEPIRDIAKTIRHFRKNVTARAFNFEEFAYPILHTDATQACIFKRIDVAKLGVDLLTLDGQKVYGPRSCGALFVRKGLPIKKISYGGRQEWDMRPGTPNVASIAGLATALELVEKNREDEILKAFGLKNYFYTLLKEFWPDVTVNGGFFWELAEKVRSGEIKGIVEYSPYIINLNIPRIDNEFFVLQLDAKGVSCSTKSSCLNDTEESYALKAIGAESKTSVRFSFGRWTTKRDINRVLEILKTIKR